MGVLCKLGLHNWKETKRWGGRTCTWCQHTELRLYDKQTGTYWEKVT
jgi:hypothetical protein